ncbi:MAG: hypothetical protein IJ934_07425 [Acetobacter sp.]|nr:hypothetical protein [Acetobacter sp.]
MSETPDHSDGHKKPEQVFGVICKDGLPFLCGVFKSRHYLVDGVQIIAVLLREYSPVAVCLGMAWEGRAKQNTHTETPNKQQEGYFG